MEKLIYVVDDEPSLLEVTKLMLGTFGNPYDVTTFEHPARALEAVKSRAPDLVISDQTMPGMSGLQLLEQIRSISPTTIRILVSGRVSNLDHIGAAQQYICKPYRHEEMRRVVTSALAARELYLGKAQICEAVASLRSFPVIPVVYHELMRLLNNPDYCVSDVSQVLLQDGGLLTKIIQLANSPLFGNSSSITDPQEAVIQLGTVNLRAIVLSLHVFSAYGKVPIPEFSSRNLWAHSLDTAQRMRRICMRAGAAPPEDGFFAGLLHDLGQLIMVENRAPEYQETMRQAARGEQEIVDLEKAAFGVHNAELAAFLLCLWGVCPLIINAIEHHHRPWEEPHTTFNLTDALYLANLQSRMQTKADGFKLPPLDHDYLKRIGAPIELVNSGPD